MPHEATLATTRRRGLTAAILLAVTSVVSAANLSIIDVGGFGFTDQSGSGATELSGITHGGGSTYYAVSDEVSKLFKLTIGLDLNSGAIQSASIDGQAIELRGEVGAALSGPDREGIAFAGTSVFIADEQGPQISQHSLTTGNRLSLITTASHPQLGVYSNARGNRAWESLTRQADGSTFWTANEEALTGDGDLANTTAGTVIRLQKFDGDLNPMGQWAYEADPIGPNFGTGLEASGVVDLVALDGGQLLVMERAATAGFRIRIYLADGFGQATDVSGPPFDSGLVNQSWTSVSKTLLFEKVLLGNFNFEGITLGPTLNDGTRSLLLVADNGSGNSHNLYALQLVPEPVSAALWGIGWFVILRRGARRLPCVTPSTSHGKFSRIAPVRGIVG